MKHIYSIIVFISLSFNCFSQEDPELKNLAWHRYVTTNFTILSIDDEQGLWMKNNLENIKSWCVSRWGLPDIRFSKECRVFCVPDDSMLSKLFGLNSSKVEVRKKDGNIEITAMWLSLGDKPAKVIPSNLSHIILSEFEQVNNIKLPYWSKKGMSQLNGFLSDIRSELSDLNNSKLFDVDSLLNLNEAQYDALSGDRKNIFVSQSSILCLLLRKEFGEVKMHSFLKVSYQMGSNAAVEKVLGFKNMQEFQKTYTRYLSGLSKDVKEKITPDSYLIIKKNER